MIGRLGHLALVVPGVHHFLSQSTRINEPCQADLRLMLHFLDIAKGGIGMNLIAFRKPTHIYRSDSRPFGLGGYSDKGFAWCFEVLEVLRFRASINLLES